MQKVNADRLSFGDVAHTVLNMALREGSQCKRIDLVFDTYKEISIKTGSGIYGARMASVGQHHQHSDSQTMEKAINQVSSISLSVN